LIEQYEGAFPFWLAPEQAVVMNITDSQADYAQEVAKSLQNNGFRAICDLRNEKIGFKIRGHSMQRVPYILVVGDKEKESRTVAVRTRDGKDLGSLPLEQVLTMFSEETEQRGRICVEETE
jgi:threonyl-tRNA synthetase